MTEHQESPPSMVLVRVGNKTVPAKSSSTCRTCQSPHRALIESWILQGFGWTAILRELEDVEDTGPLGHPTQKSLRNHVDKHMPMDARAQAAIIERRAERLGEDIKTYGGRIADHMAALDLLLADGFTRLQNGEIKIDGPALLKAISLKHQIDQSVEGGLDANVWRDALMEHMRIAIEFIHPERRREFGQALAASPVLQALAQNQRKAPKQEIAP